MKRRPLPNVDWRKYISLNNNTLNEYLREYGYDYCMGIFELISEAQTKNLQSVIMIEFAKSDVVSVVEKTDYPLVLQKLLILCERLEYYEICAEIVNYQKTISKTKVSTTKKSHKELTIK